MSRYRHRMVVLPALTVIGVVLILGLILSASIYQNLDRQRRLTARIMVEKGRTLIDSIEVLAAHLTDDASFEPMQAYLVGLVDTPDVLGLQIEGRDSGALFSYGENPRLDLENEPHTGTFEITRRLPDGRDIFEMVRPIYLGRFAPEAVGRIRLLLSMQVFSDAARRDISYTLFIGLILMAVGTAALYFIVVTQNSYLVNRALENVRNYAASVVASLADGLISFDTLGRIVTMNKVAHDLLHLIDHPDGKTVVAGKKLGELIPMPANQAFIDTVTDEKPTGAREVDLITGDGRRRPVQITCRPLVDQASGESIGRVAVLHDLSEMEQLRLRVLRSERLASLGRLAAAVAHEIRNPLNAIRGFAQYLQEKSQPEADTRRYTGIMLKEIDRLDNVIRGMLQFARPPEPRLRPVQINDLIREVSELVASDAKDQNVHVELGLDETGGEFLSDEEQLKQVLLNIALNAIAAMPDGGTLSITTSPRRDGGDGVRIDLEDTGTGIATEDLEMIFEPFHTSRPGGTGLGLAISHRIIESLGGIISVYSEVGRGTRFSIDLPVVWMNGRSEL
ncbi:PAS domain-containing protein [bacterium]|nr:PAS domain-containing protein [candidate division CSSED10-310 bacterium]